MHTKRLECSRRQRSHSRNALSLSGITPFDLLSCIRSPTSSRSTVRGSQTEYMMIVCTHRRHTHPHTTTRRPLNKFPSHTRVRVRNRRQRAVAGVAIVRLSILLFVLSAPRCSPYQGRFGRAARSCCAFFCCPHIWGTISIQTRSSRSPLGRRSAHEHVCHWFRSLTQTRSNAADEPAVVVVGGVVIGVVVASRGRRF